MSEKFGIPPSLLEAVKKVTSLQNQKHPEDVKNSANKLEPEGTKTWLATDYKKKEVKEGADTCAVCKNEPCTCETGQHIEEAEGGGTAVKDVKDQAKSQAERAKLTLQSAMLKMKQAKEREALAKKKGAIKEDSQLDELSNEKLADYKKKAGEDASKADKAGDTKKGDKRFSGIIKATKKQFANDEKTEELSPKQKEIDKNKNGKIDGEDLAHLRKKNEELSPKQKELDKNKNGKIDGSDLAKLRKEADEYKTGGKPLEKKFEKSMKKQGVDAKVDCKTVGNVSICSEFNPELVEKTDYEVYHKDYSSAVQAAIKQAEKRGYEVDMDDWHDKVATGPKKPSAGKTNSFSVKLTKDGKPVKKALQMQVYNMDNHKYELNMYIESVEESSALAQQAAIAIAKKKKQGVSERVMATVKRVTEAVEKKKKEQTAADNNTSIKGGEKLTGKKEPIEIEPELKITNSK